MGWEATLSHDKHYWKQRADWGRQGQRAGEWETENNDNVIWWHSWESCSPLVVSPSTNSELKTVNFVWIGFNLFIRQYEADCTLQVFFIWPQENCIGFYKCISVDMSVWPIDRQLVQIKKLTMLRAEQLLFWEKYLQKHMHMTTENKNKVILTNCLSTVLKG